MENIIKSLRKSTGLSQEKFANKFHIPVSNVRTWEQGINRPLDYVVYMIQVILEYEEKYGKITKNWNQLDTKSEIKVCGDFNEE